MQHTISNGTLSATIKSKGAELSSVVHQQLGLEYMWGADPAFWGKSSPILFPIVGTLKDNQFNYKNKSYQLPRHGFARDEEFTVESTSPTKVTFLQKSNSVSLQKYPFTFELRLGYALIDDCLHTSYLVTNTGTEDLYFSIGGHPAFKVPLANHLKYEDYYLEFDTPETIGRWPITNDGLIDSTPEALLQNEKRISLTRGLFANDAVVLKNIKSKNVAIKSDKDAHGLSFNFDGFPFLGLWAAKNADFVCIEPWCGIADSVNHNQALTTKEGIEKIGTGTTWTRTWKVKFS
ncbi:aldose 1-epimerase family protein [Pseudochryseolinea flava]|uniref:Aldose 1-epimerase family protein n=1 Tax=Pseudochryseolinea flava TaxID=2059302 RepID=A0A364Y1M0_9BACT|nr:aldose 1-epimerase family protein [Pseudochryseolinea flava]RAW00604.1 aldose 1-epimerase family protein [Pseudochryseolinea flava]